MGIIRPLCRDCTALTRADTFVFEKTFQIFHLQATASRDIASDRTPIASNFTFLC